MAILGVQLAQSIGTTLVAVAATLLLLVAVLTRVAGQIWEAAARHGRPLPVVLSAVSARVYSIVTGVRPQVGLLALLPSRAPPGVLAYDRTTPPRLRFQRPE